VKCIVVVKAFVLVIVIGFVVVSLSVPVIQTVLVIMYVRATMTVLV